MNREGSFKYQIQILFYKLIEQFVVIKMIRHASIWTVLLDRRGEV